MDNRVVIVTGTSQGIGAGLVRGFRDRNYSVVATSRSIKPMSDPGIVTIAGDISSPDVGERVVGEAVKQFGRVDSLVNNAGIFIGKPFYGLHASRFRKRDWHQPWRLLFALRRRR